jgi:hypothetical protein
VRELRRRSALEAAPRPRCAELYPDRLDRWCWPCLLAVAAAAIQDAEAAPHAARDGR